MIQARWLEQVLRLRNIQIQRYGGQSRVRDPGLLESALLRPPEVGVQLRIADRKNRRTEVRFGVRNRRELDPQRQSRHPGRVQAAGEHADSGGLSRGVEGDGYGRESFAGAFGGFRSTVGLSNRSVTHLSLWRDTHLLGSEVHVEEPLFQTSERRCDHRRSGRLVGRGPRRFEFVSGFYSRQSGGVPYRLRRGRNHRHSGATLTAGLPVDCGLRHSNGYRQRSLSIHHGKQQPTTGSNNVWNGLRNLILRSRALAALM
jgi:hypothetical protein